jgi:bifunctional isochorismate lyase/aryl carrier protein
VLLVTDLQRHLVARFAAGVEPISAVLANVAALRAHGAATGIPVVYTGQSWGQADEQRGLAAAFGAQPPPTAADAAIVVEPAPGDTDVVLTTWRYSAFHRTGLAELLREWGRDQLVLAGLHARLGVLLTACDAVMRDVQAFLVADAVADRSRADHLAALAYAAGHCAAVTTTETITGPRAIPAEPLPAAADR